MHARTRVPTAANEVMALAAELDSIAPIHRQKRLFVRLRECAFPWFVGRPDADPELQLRDAFTAAFVLGATEPACAAAFASHVAALFALARVEAPTGTHAATLVHLVRRRCLIATTAWTEADGRALDVIAHGAERRVHGAAEPVALLPEADVAWVRARANGLATLVFVPLCDDASCERIDVAHTLVPGARASGRLVLRGARLHDDAFVTTDGQPAFSRTIELRRACAHALVPAAWLGAAQRALEEFRTHLFVHSPWEGRDDLTASLGEWLLELRCAAAACLEALRQVAHAAFDGGFALRRARAAACAVHARAPAVAEHIVTEVRRRLGHAGLAQGHPLERMSREIRAATADDTGDATCALDAGRDFLRAAEGVALTPS